MKSLKIYLAGPIAGLTYNEATAWRKHAETKLTNIGHTIFNPMRKHLPLKGLMPTHANTDYASVIWQQDKADIENSDLMLACFLGSQHVSIGTVCEIGMATQLQIPIIVVMESGSVHDHPFVTEPAIYVTDNLDQAIRYIDAKYEPSFLKMLRSFAKGARIK